MIHYRDLKKNAKNYAKGFAIQEATEFLKNVYKVILRKLSYGEGVPVLFVALPREDTYFIEALKSKLDKLKYVYDIPINEGCLKIYLNINSEGDSYITHTKEETHET